MIVFTSYNYFLPSLVACTLWHITSYFDNSNGHWPSHDTVWRRFYLSDIVGIPGGVTNHQDVANENRCCYHHLRKGQVNSFTLFTICGRNVDWFVQWRPWCQFPLVHQLYIFGIYQTKKPTNNNQTKEKATIKTPTNKGKTYHPERESKRCHSFTRPVAFRSETCEHKLRTTIMIIMGTGQASDRPDEGFDWRSWMGGGYNVGCWMDEKLRQVEDLVWMRLKSWMMVTLSLWSRRCEWASSRTGPSMWSLTPLRSTGQSHSRGRGLEGFWLFFKS